MMPSHSRCRASVQQRGGRVRRGTFAAVAVAAVIVAASSSLQLNFATSPGCPARVRQAGRTKRFAAPAQAGLQTDIATDEATASDTDAVTLGMTFKLPGGEMRDVVFSRRPVGIEFDEGKVPIRIKGVLPGTHGEELGVKPDWILAAVSGESVEGKGFDEVWTILQEGLGALPGHSLADERVKRLTKLLTDGNYKGLMEAVGLPEWFAFVLASDVFVILLEIALVFFAVRVLPGEVFSSLPLPREALCFLRPDVCPPQ